MNDEHRKVCLTSSILMRIEREQCWEKWKRRRNEEGETKTERWRNWVSSYRAQRDLMYVSYWEDDDVISNYEETWVNSLTPVLNAPGTKLKPIHCKVSWSHRWKNRRAIFQTTIELAPVLNLTSYSQALISETPSCSSPSISKASQTLVQCPYKKSYSYRNPCSHQYPIYRF